MKTAIASFTTVMLLSAVCFAQSVTDPVKPFVNQSTLLVARVNLATVDFGALDRWADDLTTQLAPADKRQEMSRQVHGGIDTARQWSQQFTKAGGKTAWAVLSLDDISRGTPFFLIVPIEGGADVQALKAALTMQGSASVEQIGSVLVVYGEKEFPARLRNVKAEERVELMKALESADASADLIVAAAASAGGKRVLESMAPELPNKEPSTPFTQDLSWVRATVQSSSRTGRIVFQSPDEASARRLREAMLSLVRQPQGADGRKVEPLLMTLGQLVEQSKVEKDRLVIDLQRDSSTQLAARAAEGVAKARERARRMQSMSQIKQLMLGCIIYANNRKDIQYPPSLEEAAKGTDGGEKLLSNPRQPGEKVGYVYVPPADGLKADAQRLVIYEKFGQWDGVCVGFADGHCEFLSDRDKFQKLLDTAAAKKAQARK